MLVSELYFKSQDFDFKRKGRYVLMLENTSNLQRHKII